MITETFPKIINELTKKAIREIFKFHTPTLTQQKAFPVFLSGSRDILLQAPTGSGKSLVYLTTQIEAAAAGRAGDVASLVLVPNRELGEQVQEVAERLLTFHTVKAVGLLGGVRSRSQDVEALNRKEPQMLIATPGRLTHHIEATEGFGAKLGSVNFLVIDEADFLMTQGIDNQLDKIFNCLRRDKRTALVSATITEELKRLGEKTFRPNFELISVEEEGMAANLDQTAVVCDQVLPALYDQLVNDGAEKIVVFFPTAQTADFSFRIFKEKLKLPVRLLHGKLSVSERTKELKRFESEQHSILFTTDLTARGIDFHRVQLIVQVHVPVTTEQYIHRVGRTARAGQTGRAVLLLSKDEKEFITHLKRKNVPIKESAFVTSTSVAMNSFKRATQSWASSDPELIAAADDTRRSLVGYFEAGPARLNRIQNSRGIAKNFIISAGYSF